ncbi:universal stress protein [Pseudomonas aeruginosa VRFPA02]|nr:universal stress protein [Pseudomonas aeruginosa VRFPA02]
MKRILVATDLSSRSELAVMRAAALAKARNAELTVLNVLDDDQPPVLIAPQRLAIANLLEVNGQALKERLGVESKAIVRVGDPVVVINAVAEEIGADLLVMGAHRHTPLRDLFIGTTLERVVRNAKIPVLRAAGAPEEEYRRVLLALDFSPTSTRAVQMAGQLGFLDAASLTALHAFEPFAKGMMRYSGIKEDRVEHYVDQEELKANVELRDYVAGLGLGREDIQLRVGEGLPINVIMTEVRRQAPQLTVLGTQGLTGFRRALIGSVARALAGGAGRSRRAVRDREAQRAPGGPADPPGGAGPAWTKGFRHRWRQRLLVAGGRPRRGTGAAAATVDDGGPGRRPGGAPGGVAGAAADAGCAAFPPVARRCPLRAPARRWLGRLRQAVPPAGGCPCAGGAGRLALWGRP